MKQSRTARLTRALTVPLKTINSKDYKLYYMNASSNLKSELKS